MTISSTPTRFVIVGTQRTGTTLIRTQLDAHSRVRCIGETFKLGSQPYEGSLGYWNYVRESNRRRFVHWLRRGRSIESYLDSLDEIEGVDAVGFKLMFSQLQSLPGITDYLETHSVRAINVIRLNSLRTLISRDLARKSGLYHSTSTVPKDQTRTMNLPVRDLRARLKKIDAERDLWQKTLGDRVKLLTVAYEEFVADPDAHTREMLDFIGVPFEKLQSQLKKVTPNDLSAVLENYDEVRDALSGTEFDRFLA